MEVNGENEGGIDGNRSGMRSGCRNKGQEIHEFPFDAGWKCSVGAMCYWGQTKWREISPEGSYAKR